MPRKSKGPKLWFDVARQSWTIVDGRKNIRVGVGVDEKAALSDYITGEHRAARRLARAPRPEPRTFDGRPLMTLEVVAEKVFNGSVTTEALRREIAEGRLHAYMIGNKYFATPDSVDELANGPTVLKRSENNSGVYVIGFGPYIKIGVSIKVKSRVASLQMPERVDLHAIFEGGVREEVILHRRFAEYRLQGEWFRREGELAEWIAGGCK